MKRSIGWLPAVLAGAAALAFLLLNLSAAGGGSRDYDEGVYWQALRSLSAGHQLFKEIFAPQGPVFFYGLLPFYDVFGHSIEAARIGIAVYSLIGAAAMFAAATAVGGRWAGLISVLLLLTDPIWAVESQTLHAEIPALAFGLIALAFAAAAGRSTTARQQVWLAAGAGTALALGMATKAFVIVFAVPMIIYLGQRTLRSSRRPWLSGVAAFLVVAVALFLPFLQEARAVFDDLIAVRFAASRALGRGIGYNASLLHLGRELPIELGAIAVLLLCLLRRDRAVIPGAAWIAATNLALLLYQPLFPHELALLIPALAFTIALGAVRLAGMPSADLFVQPRAIEAAVAGGIMLISGVASIRDIGASVNAAARHAHEDALAANLKTLTPQSELIIGDNPYAIALADRNCPPELVDTSFAQIASGFLSTERIKGIARQQGVSAFVFDTGRLEAAPGLKAWVAQNYQDAISIGGGTIYFRPR